MSRQLHVHDLPSDNELRQMVGAATPHFAPQIRERLTAFSAALPPDDPRQPWLERQIARMMQIGRGGEPGDGTVPDLPTRASLDR